MTPARRRGPIPLRLSPATDLTPERRMMVVAMRQEAVSPTVRLRFLTLGALLLVASGVGFVLGALTVKS